MSPLAGSCFHHPQRAAAGRCERCGRGFCQECLTPHAGRLRCAACMRDLAQATAQAQGPRRWPAWLGAFAGVLLLWTLYAALGWTLARLPSDAHTDTPPQAVP